MAGNPLRNIVERRYVYKGKIVNMRVDRVKFPSGLIRDREVVEHGSAVAILAVDCDGKIFLVSQYRHAVDKELYELPAGLVNPGEEPAVSAVRELQEEIGFRPGRLLRAAEFYSSPGFTDEKIVLYYATDLHKSKLPEDEDEYISIYKFTPEEIKGLISANKIQDGKTIMAYCWYAAKTGIRNAVW